MIMAVPLQSKSKSHSPSLFIVMGVSGSGKSSLAKQLANELLVTFIDADDFHSVQAKEHMAANKPLTDEMRKPWLASILAHLQSLSQQGKSVALAYSGLKSMHRTLFRQLPFHCHFFYLVGDKSVIAKRISEREKHFFSAELLDSQFSAMEPPLPDEEDVSAINIDRPFLSVTDEIINLAQFLTWKINHV
jgi:gluconokinase